jgi:hypothetical protein
VDPRVKFFEECAKDHLLVMPILDKIIDYALTLKNYKMNTGTCKAIAKFLSLNLSGLQQLSLHLNSMDANMINIILEGLV